MTTTFSQGQVVNVLRRQWPGVNKHGGIARITRVNSDDTVSVSYIIGDYKEAAVSTKFVEPWGENLEVNLGRQSRSTSRSLRGARTVKAPKQFDEAREEGIKPPLGSETIGRAATVATGHELPELPLGTPKFIVQQAKEMEKVIAKIEKEDMYEMFRTERDPIDLLKGTVDAESSAEDQGNAKAAAADAGASVVTTRGWMAPVRSKSPNQRRSASPSRGAVGGWEHPAEKKRTASQITRRASDGGGGGGGGRGWSASSRKRPRKDAEATPTPRQSADGVVNSPPSPQRPSPPPNPPQVEDRSRDAKEVGGAPQQEMGNASYRGGTPSLQENRQQQQQQIQVHQLEQQEHQVPRQEQRSPINLPQIRERFVNGYYVPPPGSYLYRADATTGEGGDQSPEPAAPTSAASVCEVDAGKLSTKRSGTSCRRAQKKQPETSSSQENPSVAAVTAANAASPVPSKNTPTVASEGMPPPIAREPPPPDEPAGSAEPRVCEVALTRDSGRLGPAAKLTFDYEPLLEWEGLRSDIETMVKRMLTGADEWRAEKLAKAAMRTEGGMEDDDSSDDNFDEESVEEYVEKARRFLAVSEEFVTKQREKAEKERYALAVKRSVEDFTRWCQAAAMQGALRTEPFPLRVYKEYLKEYKPASDLREEDKEAIKRELRSSLKDGYRGQAYGYDDHGISEMWMQTYMGEAQEGATPASQKAGVGQLSDEAIRVQVNNLMETMCITVVDSVNNDMRGVNKPPKVLPKYKVLAPDGKTVVEVMETPSPPVSAGDGLEGKNSTGSGGGDSMVVEDALSSSRTSPAEVVDSTNNGGSEGAVAGSSGRAVERHGMKHKKAALKSTGGLELGGQLEERSVWGIDCYTRTNVEHVLDLTLGLSKEQSRLWITKTLLPALNRQRGPRGVDMLPALRDLCKVIPDGETEAERRESARRAEEEEFDLGPKAKGEHLVAAQALLHVIEGFNSQSLAERGEPLARVYFHCHPKGTGVICKDKKGVEADTFVTEYLGELYPAWRWSEKTDAVEEAKLKHGLKPELPDFYNIILERPREDARGYGLLYVDAGNHVGNFSSSLSHSCNANCTTATAVRNGKLCVTLTTTRAIAEGEELTMDYGAITSCETEYNKAVCLCGSHLCRQSFMTFTGSRALHEVLRGFGPLMTFKTLIQSAADKPMNSDEADALSSHGFKSSALGDECPPWLKKFAAMQLRYVEYERRKLPPALLTASGAYTHQSADAEARAVMERRVQSLVDVLSSVYHFLQEQKRATELATAPTTPSSTSKRNRRGKRTGGGSSGCVEMEAMEVSNELSGGGGEGGGDGVGPFAALSEKPPLKLLEDCEVIEALWSGKQSMMRRLIRRLEAVYSERGVVEMPEEDAEMEEGKEEEQQLSSDDGKPWKGKSMELVVRRGVIRVDGGVGSGGAGGGMTGGGDFPPPFESPVILRERILMWDNREEKCITHDAPPRDELVEWLSTRPNMEVYTGQGVPPGVAGEGGIRADRGEPHHPEDKILLWNAIKASRVPCKDLPRRKYLAAHISIRPELYLYAGQDAVEDGTWYGAKEARGVADAYAAAVLIPSGDLDERIPLWHSVTKKVIMGKDAPTRQEIHRYLRTRPHLKLYTGQDMEPRRPRKPPALPQQPTPAPPGDDYGRSSKTPSSPRSASQPQLPGFGSAAAVTPRLPTNPRAPASGIEEQSNGLIGISAAAPRRTISPFTVWAPRADGAPPKGFSSDPAVAMPRVVDHNGMPAGEVAATEGGFTPRSPRSLSSNVRVDVGADEDPADERAKLARSAVNAAAKALTATGQFYCTEPVRPNGWVARLQPSNAVDEGWGTTTAALAPSAPVADYDASAIATAAAATATATAPFYCRSSNGGPVPFSHPNHVPLPLRQQLQQPPLWGVHPSRPLPALWIPPAFSMSSSSPAPAAFGREANVFVPSSAVGQAAKANSGGPLQNRQPPQHPAYGFNQWKYPGYEMYNSASPWGLGFVRQMNSWVVPPRLSMPQGAGKEGAGSSAEVDSAIPAASSQWGRGVDSQVVSEALPPSADAPNGEAGYGSVNGNGSNNSVSAAVGSGISDTVGLGVSVGVNASGKAISGVDAENSTRDVEGTASSSEIVGADSGGDPQRGVLGIRSREDGGGDAPGAGRMEPNKRKKPRARAGSGLVRGRGGAVLKRQGARTEGGSATPLSSSKNGFTGNPREDIVAAPCRKDFSPPETETESSHAAAGTCNVATASGSRKVWEGKTGGSAGAEDKRCVVGSGKAVGSRTTGDGVDDCAGKRIRGVSKKELQRVMAEGEPEDHVEMWHPTTQRILKGKRGPQRKRLAVFCQKYPHYEFYVDQKSVCGEAPRRRRRSSSPAQQPPKVQLSQDQQQQPQKQHQPKQQHLKQHQAEQQQSNKQHPNQQQPQQQQQPKQQRPKQHPKQQQPKQQQPQQQQQPKQKQPKQQQLQQPREPKQQQLQARPGVPVLPEKRDLDTEDHRPLDRKAWAAGQEVIGKIRDMLESENVPHRGVLKKLLLKVRELLLELRPLPNARHGAAADVLLLLAHTKTFAIPTTYATVRGDSVQVLAKELGNNVPRAVLRRYKNEKRAAAARAAGSRNAMSPTTATVATADATVAAASGDGAGASPADAHIRAAISPTELKAPESRDLAQSISSKLDAVGPRSCFDMKRVIGSSRLSRGGDCKEREAQERDTEGEENHHDDDEDDHDDEDDVTSAISKLDSPGFDGVETPGVITARGDGGGGDGGRGGRESTTRESGASAAGGGSSASSRCKGSDGVEKDGGGASSRAVVGSPRGGKGRKAGRGRRGRGSRGGRGGRGRLKWVAPSRPPPRPPGPKPEAFLKGNEVVHEYTPISGPHYVLAQLLQWHNHGEGGNPNEPFDDKLRGCVRLPDVLEAYEGTGAYTSSQRLLLMNHLESPEQRKHPWPAKLESAFGAEEPEEPTVSAAAETGDKIEVSAGVEIPTTIANGSAIAACKSPEGAGSSSSGNGGGGADSGSSQLGGGVPGRGGPVAARGRAARGGRGGRFGGGGGSRSRRGGFGGKGRGAVGGMAAGVGGMVLLGSPMVDATLDDTQGLRAVIEVLKREMGHGGGALKVEEDGPQSSNRTPWAQCDICRKWRRMPWHVDPGRVQRDSWSCRQNTWDPERASCDVPEEKAAEEMAVEFAGSSVVKEGDFERGMWIDVYRPRLLRWLSARVIQMDEKRVLVHYHKFSKKNDEWIDKVDEQRIQRVHTHTNSISATAAWLGLVRSDGKSNCSDSGSDWDGTSDSGSVKQKASSAGKPSQPPESDFVYYGTGGVVGKSSMSREERTKARLNRAPVPPSSRPGDPLSAEAPRKKLVGAAKMQWERKRKAKAAAAAAAAAEAQEQEQYQGVSLGNFESAAAAAADRAVHEAAEKVQNAWAAKHFGDEWSTEGGTAGAVAAAAAAVERATAMIRRGETLITPEEAEIARSLLVELATSFHSSPSEAVSVEGESLAPAPVKAAITTNTEAPTLVDAPVTSNATALAPAEASALASIPALPESAAADRKAADAQEEVKLCQRSMRLIVPTREHHSLPSTVVSRGGMSHKLPSPRSSRMMITPQHAMAHHNGLVSATSSLDNLDRSFWPAGNQDESSDNGLPPTSSGHGEVNLHLEPHCGNRGGSVEGIARASAGSRDRACSFLAPPVSSPKGNIPGAPAGDGSSGSSQGGEDKVNIPGGCSKGVNSGGGSGGGVCSDGSLDSVPFTSRGEQTLPQKRTLAWKPPSEIVEEGGPIRSCRRRKAMPNGSSTSEAMMLETETTTRRPSSAT